jgi:hypothetical protein
MKGRSWFETAERGCISCPAVLGVCVLRYIIQCDPFGIIATVLLVGLPYQ